MAILNPMIRQGWRPQFELAEGWRCVPFLPQGAVGIEDRRDAMTQLTLAGAA